MPAKIIADVLLREIIEAQADSARKREAADKATSLAETSEREANTAGKRVATLQAEAVQQGVQFVCDGDELVTGVEVPAAGWDWP